MPSRRDTPPQIMRHAHPDITPPGEVPDPDGRRWISINDDAGDVWMFDVTYLLSRFHCIYGQGCPGIDVEPDHTETLGCCVHGAYFVDGDDMKDTFKHMKRLTADDWQFKSVAADHTKGKGKKASEHGAFVKLESGEWTTRVHQDACIFLNRDDHDGGPGCALHSAALRAGERPMDWKPDVCWQVPIRMDVHTDDNERDTVMVRGWERHDWGAGGSDFHWWCHEEPEAYTAAQPVYITSRDELIGLVGGDIYRALAEELDEISQQRVTPVTLDVRR
ncbi:MAG: hypothetical protein HKN24_08140 [Acidimicrobiales bacterium]|nr:hypothetical protein [Acidimicrobiales bacterium]